MDVLLNTVNIDNSNPGASGLREQSLSDCTWGQLTAATVHHRAVTHSDWAGSRWAQSSCLSLASRTQWRTHQDDDVSVDLPWESKPQLIHCVCLNVSSRWIFWEPGWRLLSSKLFSCQFWSHQVLACRAVSGVFICWHCSTFFTVYRYDQFSKHKHTHQLNACFSAAPVFHLPKTLVISRRLHFLWQHLFSTILLGNRRCL